ncbi:MAG: BMP family ABC transporter substrate-binding protein [Vallitaleaceae bacterium]|jgi:basic membrane protein A|nr:BMP family ABC transporter substrate-binding protein [Vallitaleaceae bacterium]
MKRIFLLLLIIDFLVISLCANPSTYASVNTHEQEAQALHDLALFDGINPTSFNPDLESLSNREQAMKIIAVALQWELDMNAKSPFDDVSSWAQPYVAKAYQLGITLGKSSTQFGGKDNVTRKELATWMLRALGHESVKAWNETEQLSAQIGTVVDVQNGSQIIIRDQLVAMLFSFLKEGKVLTKTQTLIQAYLAVHPEYADVAVNHGMLNASDVPDAQQNAQEKITIGLATEPAGIADDAFSEMAWEGIERFSTEYGLNSSDYTYAAALTDSDYETPINALIAEDKDLIVAAGFMFTDPVQSAAQQYPSQQFLVIDAIVDMSNVASIVFKEQEGSYLAGIAAGLKAQSIGSTKVGFIGGIDFELIQRFEAGYEAGVHAIDPNIDVVIGYAGSFADQTIGSDMASTMYDEGVSVIYIAAGVTGNGAITEAKERAQNGEDVWVIGVDRDQYQDGLYDGSHSVILTSMVKAIDVAAYDICLAVYNNTFTGGLYSYGLAENGVRLPATNPNLTAAWTLQITQYKDNIISGQIIVPVIPERLQ